MTDYAGIEQAVREIVGRIVTQVEDEHARHLTEELRIQSRQLDAYAARISELETALKPFADVANYFDNEPRYTDEDSPCEAFNTFAELRAAAAALESKK